MRFSDTRRLEEDSKFHWFEHAGRTMGSVAVTHMLNIASDVTRWKNCQGIMLRLMDKYLILRA
jgi:hypothetical protein